MECADCHIAASEATAFCESYGLCDTCIRAKKTPSKEDMIRLYKGQEERMLRRDTPPIYVSVYTCEGELKQIVLEPIYRRKQLENQRE